MSSRTLEKFIIVVAVAVLGVALAVNVRSTPALLLVGALVVTISAGLDLALRGDARYRATFDLFILPAALVVGAVLFLQLLSVGTAIVAGLTAFGSLLFVTFWAEHRLRREAADRGTAVLALTVVSYVAAFVLYAAVYQAKSRTLFSAPAILLISLLLATRQFLLAQDAVEPGPAAAEVMVTAARAHGAMPARSRWTQGTKAVLYAGVVALTTSEITWALNYWPVNGLLGGAFLLSGFYFMTGMLSQHLQHRLTGRLVAEYGMVALAGTLLITMAGLVRRASGS